MRSIRRRSQFQAGSCVDGFEPAETKKKAPPNGRAFVFLYCIRSSCSSRVEWLDVNIGFVIGLLAEHNCTVNQCEQGVILADSDVVAGVMLGSTLTYDDIAGDDFLTAEDLDAKALAMGFASVLGTTDAFLVCHVERGLEAG